MISRLAEKLIHELAEQFPVVLILGPRQCGKTTLAKHFLDAEYFDLERPADQDIFLDDIEFALNQFKHPLILDEAQTLPELFPVLRSLVDRNRQLNGRYFLLGSVNPSLIRKISQSLAGRVGIVELTPFLFPELSSKTTDLTALWLKGGYPDAFNAANASHWQRWQENYARTLIERDIPAHGGKLSAIQIRRFMGMIANLHGGLLNASDLGRSLGNFLSHCKHVSRPHGRPFSHPEAATLSSKHQKKDRQVAKNIYPRHGRAALPARDLHQQGSFIVAQAGQQLGRIPHRAHISTGRFEAAGRAKLFLPHPCRRRDRSHYRPGI